MNTLALLNPRKRRKSTKARRKSSSPRRKAARKASPARAIHRKRPMRRRRHAARRRSGGGAFRPRKITVLANPRRRRSGRRGYRRNPFGGMKGALGSVTGIFSKENLAMVAGGVGATIVVAQVTGRWGEKLPLWKKSDGGLNPVGVALYDIALPVAAAALVRKYAPNVAKGLVLGGLISAARDALQLFAPATSVALYNPAAATSAAGLYLGAPGSTSARATLGLNAMVPGYQAANAFRRVQTFNSPLGNSGAFAGDAFATRAALN